MIASDSTIIRTLRIKTATSDRLAARQQTERALQAASLRPIGLPRDAILIVRQIKSSHAGTASWEQAVNAQLDQLVRQAARPIEGMVPAHAQAVIFADRSELLACLAADWCAGEVRSRWWWQSWLRGDDLTRAVIDAWLETPEYIPLALQRLVARRQVIAFVQQLNSEHTRLLLHVLVQTFGLYELATILDKVIEQQPEGREAIAQNIIHATSALPVPVRPASLWQPWIQAHFEHLPPDRQVLLGVGLMLHAAPMIVRSASFASEVKDWHAAIRMAQAQPHASADSAPALTRPPSSPTIVESEATQQTEAALNFHAASADDLAEPTTLPSLRGGRRPTKQSHSDQRDTRVVSELAAQLPARETEAHLAETLAPAEAEQSQFDIETEFGGVYYFINLGLFLNLYGDFTTPLLPGLDLPIWDFVALVAQDLIGDEVIRDPIWTLLAQLADRAEDEPPGARFNPPEDWSRGFSRLADWSIIPAEASTPDSRTPTTWFADLMSIIRPRLQAALGVSADELPRYFKQHARIVVSAVNFDAYFALADLPIEIRLSGLDRDPGWVPAAGRTVRFHYD